MNQDPPYPHGLLTAEPDELLDPIDELNYAREKFKDTIEKIGIQSESQKQKLLQAFDNVIEDVKNNNAKFAVVSHLVDEAELSRGDQTFREVDRQSLSTKIQEYLKNEAEKTAGISEEEFNRIKERYLLGKKEIDAFTAVATAMKSAKDISPDKVIEIDSNVAKKTENFSKLEVEFKEAKELRQTAVLFEQALYSQKMQSRIDMTAESLRQDFSRIQSGQEPLEKFNEVRMALKKYSDFILSLNFTVKETEKTLQALHNQLNAEKENLATDAPQEDKDALLEKMRIFNNKLRPLRIDKSLIQEANTRIAVLGALQARIETQFPSLQHYKISSPGDEDIEEKLTHHVESARPILPDSSHGASHGYNPYGLSPEIPVDMLKSIELWREQQDENLKNRTRGIPGLVLGPVIDPAKKAITTGLMNGVVKPVVGMFKTEKTEEEKEEKEIRKIKKKEELREAAGRKTLLERVGTILGAPLAENPIKEIKAAWRGDKVEDLEMPGFRESHDETERPDQSLSSEEASSVLSPPRSGSLNSFLEEDTQAHLSRSDTLSSFAEIDHDQLNGASLAPQPNHHILSDDRTSIDYEEQQKYLKARLADAAHRQATSTTLSRSSSQNSFTDRVFTASNSTENSFVNTPNTSANNSLAGSRQPSRQSSQTKLVVKPISEMPDVERKKARVSIELPPGKRITHVVTRDMDGLNEGNKEEVKRFEINVRRYGVIFPDNASCPAGTKIRIFNVRADSVCDVEKRALGQEQSAGHQQDKSVKTGRGVK